MSASQQRPVVDDGGENFCLLKDPTLAGYPITVRRYLAFLVLRSSIDGQGTDGRSIQEGRVW